MRYIDWWDNFLSLFYPRSCLACQRNLLKQEKLLCLHCQTNLPVCDYHSDPQNPLVRKFWGRLPLEVAVAFLKYSKGNQVQQIIHVLKYEGEEEISGLLGKMYGETLAKFGFISRFDAIIPVPLHPQKEKIRGYNQCKGFAVELASKLQAEALPQALKRNVFTNSQTRQSRVGRFENMRNVFDVTDKKMVADKHILLVDDVITTGATLEACGNVLLENGVKKLSIAAMAAA